MLAVSSETWRPNCASQGTTVRLSLSASSGICSRSSGTSLLRIGTTSSSSASKARITATSITSTASTRGTRRAARRSTAGCSA